MPKKILLADDSITIQKVVELTFSDGDYEVIAVNNGAKAIQKLSEMRPDIILSDIIMPEKNGYEVCEYVKSHPEYRNIPVILLTGTFEPFDPDRADKAGCDAVVTKPFESQSLIHKVEELIHQSQTNASAAESEAQTSDLFTDAPAFPPSVPADPFGHSTDIFSAPAAAAPAATEMPFDSPAAYGGETRAFPRMSFEDMEQMAHSASVPAEPALPSTAPQPAMPEPEPEVSPWDEQPAAFGGETRAFPRMSFEEMEQMAAEQQPPAVPPPPAAAPEAPRQELEMSPWDEPAEDAGATRAVPAMSFDEMRRMADAAHPEPAPFEAPESAPAPAPEASPWDDQPSSFAGETTAFPTMSFDDMATPAPPPAAAQEPVWAPSEEIHTDDPFADSSESESPFALSESPEPAHESEPEPEHQLEPEPIAHEPIAPEPAFMAASEPATTGREGEVMVPSDLTEEQIDRIARRVVQLMSDQVVRNIAWEVIPDLAEIVVKERIRELEAEA
jgi:CheY-like chemotaxis protein